MISSTMRLLFLNAVVLLVALTITAQTRPARPKPRATPLPVVTDPDTPAEQKDIETLKTDTNLVTVPVIATNRAGTYLADLTKDEFMIVEDGVKQEIAFFSHVSAPFHVVLMLDTSASTQAKLSLIQKAAYTFVQQLQTADRVKVISFDDQVYDLNEFTNDRELLRVAINRTKSGNGTRVYDAVSLALNTLRPIKGRKAIVIFSDGVDWHSVESTFDGTVRWLDEEGVIVYPIRYDTRQAAERIAREQSDGISASLPTIDVLTGGGGATRPGSTPKTFPSDDPVPTIGTSSKTGPLGLPSPQEIMRRRREQERERDAERGRAPGEMPGPPTPSDPSTRPPMGTTRRAPRPDDSITATLDLAYSTADSYLQILAEKSGGKLVRADTLVSLPDAFAQIAAELRTQYSLGYYPTKKEGDDKYRKIKVSTTRKDVAIRSRPGYLATKTK